MLIRAASTLPGHGFKNRYSCLICKCAFGAPQPHQAGLAYSGGVAVLLSSGICWSGLSLNRSGWEVQHLHMHS